MSTVLTITMPEEDASIVIKALRDAVQFFYFRDSMNAALHREGVRRSPLTDAVILARDKMEQAMEGL